MEENINKLTFTSPSMLSITIREQNGNDDDVISNVNQVDNGTSIINFMHGIILDIDGKKPTVEQLLNLRFRDRIVILLMSRIYSIGQIIEFEVSWDDLPTPIKYEEDLSIFIWDYSKPFPNPGDINFNPNTIKPYIESALFRELVLKSGKKVRYDYTNSHTDIYLMNVPLAKQSINQELLARDIKLFIGNDWVKVENFSTFSSSDMREIRTDIATYDPPIYVNSTITHPNKPGLTRQVPLLANVNFFFPART